MADEENGAGFRVTTGTLFVQIDGLKTEIAGLKTEVAVLSTNMATMLAALATGTVRVEKLEGRFNGMLVGIGVGIATALVAVFKGVVT